MGDVAMGTGAGAGSRSMSATANAYPWWALLLQSIIAIIAGLLLVGAGNITTAQGTMIVVQVVGWYWFFVGIMNLILMFVDHSMWGWKLFAGIIGILAGLTIIQHPYWATFALPYILVIILGIEGIIIGFVDIIKGFQGGGWGIGLLGVLSILIGGWLLAERYVAALALPWAIGLLALIFGVVGIFAAFSYRKAQEA